MDNKILEKLIKNYDDNVLYLEQADEARQKSSIISTNLRRLLMNLAKEESHAQAVMDELVSYLQNFTKTKQKAKKELDFVRVEADRLGYGFEPLARVYAQEFYPAAKQAGLTNNITHNLFTGVSEYSASQNATTEMLSRLLGELSSELKNGGKPDVTLLNNSTLPDINIEVQEAFNRSSNKDNLSFYKNFADLLHFKYSDSVVESLEPNVVENNRINNEIFDHLPEYSLLKNLLGFIFGIGAALDITNIPGMLKNPKLGKGGLSGILGTIYLSALGLDYFGAREVRNNRYQNGYTYDEFAGEPNFFKGDEAEKIYGSIRMYVPFRDTQMFAAPESSAPTAIPDRINSIDNSSRVAGGNSFNFANGAFNFNITSTNPAQSAQEVRQVLLSVFDDVGMLMGYERKQL